jgi:hypothetical protein
VCQREAAFVQDTHRHLDTLVTEPGGLIFGLIRIRSSVFISVRINLAMQVPDVSGMQRTITPSPENRKVDGSVLSLTTTLNSVTLLCFLSLIIHRPDMIDVEVLRWLDEHRPPVMRCPRPPRKRVFANFFLV